MSESHGVPPGLRAALEYLLFQSEFDRKSRRVGLGITVESDVIEYTSPHPAVPPGAKPRKGHP